MSDKPSTLEIPDGTIFELSEEGLTLGHHGDVVIRGDIGHRIKKIFSETGSVRLAAPRDLQVEIVEAKKGSVVINGRARIRSINADEVQLESGDLEARSVVGESRVILNGGTLTTDLLMGAEIYISPEVEGRATVIECHNVLPPHKLRGGFRLTEFMDLLPSAQKTLQGESQRLPSLKAAPEARQEPEKADHSFWEQETVSKPAPTASPPSWEEFRMEETPKEKGEQTPGWDRKTVPDIRGNEEPPVWEQKTIPDGPLRSDSREPVQQTVDHSGDPSLDTAKPVADMEWGNVPLDGQDLEEVIPNTEPRNVSEPTPMLEDVQQDPPLEQFTPELPVPAHSQKADVFTPQPESNDQSDDNLGWETTRVSEENTHVMDEEFAAHDIDSLAVGGSSNTDAEDELNSLDTEPNEGFGDGLAQATTDPFGLAKEKGSIPSEEGNQDEEETTLTPHGNSPFWNASTVPEGFARPNAAAQNKSQPVTSSDLESDLLDPADIDDAPVGAPMSDQLQDELFHSLERLEVIYFNTPTGVVPPAVEELGALIRRRQHEATKQELRRLWNDLIQFHKETQTMIPNLEISQIFRVIQSKLASHGTE